MIDLSAFVNAPGGWAIVVVMLAGIALAILRGYVVPAPFYQAGLEREAKLSAQLDRLTAALEQLSRRRV